MSENNSRKEDRMDGRKLKASMVEAGKTPQEMAAVCGISVNAWRNKANGKTEFTVNEAYKVKEALCLTPYRTMEIFFANERETNSREGEECSTANGANSSSMNLQD